MPKTIVLIACVSRKATFRSKVRDLYQGPLFTESLAYAQALQPDHIYVLSALHHVLRGITQGKRPAALKKLKSAIYDQQAAPAI